MMAFRTLLSVVGVDAGERDIELAARLCEEAGAHLTVLVAALAAPPPIGEYAAMVSDAWFEERQEDVRALDERTRVVSGFAASQPVSSDVSSIYAEEAGAAQLIGQRGRYADLTLAGPDLLAGERLRGHCLEGALFFSGNPLLVVPDGSKATLKPRRVLVAWDARLEAARAMHEALPMLAEAEEVRLVLVDPVPGERQHGEEPGADAAAFLARHGARVTVDRLPREGRSVADVLRRSALDMGADMMVMGAYGHSRLRERIFGGVTRSMLDNPPLPVFMAR